MTKNTVSMERGGGAGPPLGNWILTVMQYIQNYTIECRILFWKVVGAALSVFSSEYFRTFFAIDNLIRKVLTFFG